MQLVVLLARSNSDVVPIRHYSVLNIRALCPLRVQSRETLAEYITFARKNIHPQLTEEACRSLMDGYVQMRKAGNVRQTISATPRQLESLIRLSEAHARMR